MENQRYLRDLGEIKEIMHRSSRFISLSGLAGVFAGAYALAGALIAEIILSRNPDVRNSIYSLDSSKTPNFHLSLQLFWIAIAVLLLAVGTAIFLTTRKAKRNNQQIWNAASKRLITNFFVPLSAGGIFCLILLQYSLLGLIAPSMLIFYGLALIHASKYSFDDLRSLGYLNLVLGLIATQFIDYGIYFWAAGFGLFHILYGLWMYNRYERNPE